MKSMTIKSFVTIIALYAFGLNAQNTSIGIPSGSYKDTATTYRDDPAKHAHTQTTVIDNGKSNNKAAPDNGSGDNQDNSAGSTTENNSAEPGYNSSSSTETSTVTTSEDNCSCNTLHIAYGISAAGILGTLIFLALYLKEKNKGKQQSQA